MKDDVTRAGHCTLYVAVLFMDCVNEYQIGSWSHVVSRLRNRSISAQVCDVDDMYDKAAVLTLIDVIVTQVIRYFCGYKAQT